MAAAFAPYRRPIAKPVAGQRARRGGGRRREPPARSGTSTPPPERVTFRPGSSRRRARRSRPGFLFDVPVRFDTDELLVDLDGLRGRRDPARSRSSKSFPDPRSARCARFPRRSRPRLADGATTLARCWKLTRRDGVTQGFTDHDRDLSFGGVVYAAGDRARGRRHRKPSSASRSAAARSRARSPRRASPRPTSRPGATTPPPSRSGWSTGATRRSRVLLDADVSARCGAPARAFVGRAARPGAAARRAARAALPGGLLGRSGRRALRRRSRRPGVSRGAARSTRDGRRARSRRRRRSTASRTAGSPAGKLTLHERRRMPARRSR